MIPIKFSQFRKDLKFYLDKVEKNQETVLIKRNSGKGSVLVSIEEYHGILETIHLLKSRKNANRLFESIEQMKTGSTHKPA